MKDIKRLIEDILNKWFTSSYSFKMYKDTYSNTNETPFRVIKILEIITIKYKILEFLSI